MSPTRKQVQFPKRRVVLWFYNIGRWERFKDAVILCYAPSSGLVLYIRNTQLTQQDAMLSNENRRDTLESTYNDYTIYDSYILWNICLQISYRELWFQTYAEVCINYDRFLVLAIFFKTKVRRKSSQPFSTLLLLQKAMERKTKKA